MTSDNSINLDQGSAPDTVEGPTRFRPPRKMRMARIEHALVRNLLPTTAVASSLPFENGVKSGPFDSIRDNDILMGREKGLNDRKGNLHYHKLLQAAIESYKQLSVQEDKSSFTATFVQEAQKFGRFVQRIPGKKQFIEISDRAAQVKVGQVCTLVDNNEHDIDGWARVCLAQGTQKDILPFLVVVAL